MIPAIGMAGGLGMFLLFALAPLAFIILALVDILKNEFEPHSNKLVWLLVVLFMPLIGSILYFIIGRNSKIDPRQKF